MEQHITRPIKEQEIVLIEHLLHLANKHPTNFPIAQEAHEYEGGKMGSINLVNPNAGEYAGDLIKVEYTDTDGTKVLISLTHDSKGQLLDLDFWKADFSALITYPEPKYVKVSEGFL